MADEVIPSPVEGQPAEPTPAPQPAAAAAPRARAARASAPPAPAAPAPTPEPPDFETVLGHLDRYLEDPANRQKLRGHRVVAGLAGDIVASKQRESEAERSRKAFEQAEEELLKLADEDPEALAARFKDTKLAERTQRQIREQEQRLKDALSAQIAAGVKDLPEYADMTADDHSALMKRLTGLTDDGAVLAAYTKGLVDLLASKRAERLKAEWADKQLPKEREAIHREEAQKLRQRLPAPNLRPPQPAPASDEPDWEREPVAWNKWYESRHPGARRTAVA